MDFRERIILRTFDRVFDVAPRMGGTAIDHLIRLNSDVNPSIWHTRVQREGPIDEFQFPQGIDNAGVDHFISTVSQADPGMPVLYRDLRIPRQP